MIRLHATPLNLTLRHAFSTARHTSHVARNVLLELTCDGVSGLGEAAPISLYGQSQESCIAALERMAPEIEARDPFDLENILSEMQRRHATEMSAICALDLALHDWIGKVLKVPIWKMNGLNPANAPQTSFTIGIDTLEKVAAKVEEAREYPILKIKVGSNKDLEIMREVRRIAPGRRLRVDANCGWSVEEAIEKSKFMAELGVEFIEQPIRAGDNAALRRIKENSALPIISDESSCTLKDVLPLAGCVDGINIKLVKCGGLREALKMIHCARAAGLKVMLGCMIESSVLISAAAQLAPLADYADLDGNVLIADDPFRGVSLDAEKRLVLADRPGLGVGALR